MEFWSSAVLTGNRTVIRKKKQFLKFWSSAVLTGNRTRWTYQVFCPCFGAVPF